MRPAPILSVPAISKAAFLSILFSVSIFFAFPQSAYAAGSQTYSSPGSYSFTVPSYGSLTVQVRAGGGGASNYYAAYYPGQSGGLSSFNGSVVAYGGATSNVCGFGSGAGGSATGGDGNYTGGAGGLGSGKSVGGVGGNGANGGGAGGAYNYSTGNGLPGSPPGGGGAGRAGCDGAGGGGASVKTYSSGQLTVGSAVSVVVGAGGVAGVAPISLSSGAGAPGSVTITWTSPPVPTCSINASPTTINEGSGSSLTWTSANATTFYITNIGYVTANVSSGATVYPSTTITYSGTATGAGGTANCSATVTVNQSCTFNGNTVLHGGSVTAYQASTVPYGSSCTSQSRSCSNGTLSGTYAYASCSVTPAANCTLDGVTVLHGASDTFYTTLTAPVGQTCSSGTVSQSRTCTDGTLSGSATYQYGTCSCAPIYSCSGDDIQYTNAACSTSTVDTCVSPSFCTAGQSSCIYPDPVFNAGATTTGHLQASPQLVRKGLPARLYWNVSNVESCTISGNNGDSWIAPTSGSSGQQTSPISSTVFYTLRCNAFSGITPSMFTETVTVLPSPEFVEQ